MVKCFECLEKGEKVELTKEKLTYTSPLGLVYIVDGLRCSKCGAEIFDAETSAKISQVEKQLKSRLILKRKLTKVGESLVLRIPKDIAEQMNLKAGKEVGISLEGTRKLVVTIAE